MIKGAKELRKAYTIVELYYGSKTITVKVYFESRKRLSITVHPDMQVIAKAPSDQPIEKVTAYLKKRAPWIVRHLNYFEDFQPILPPKKYISGETHYYLGRQYRLRIREGEKTQVKLIGKFFQMELTYTNNSSKARDVMLDWYSFHAKQLLTRRVNIYQEYFLKQGAAEPNLKFRQMKKRWGSCSTNGTIMLNTELVKTPIYCIDYVLIHELCHIIYLKHDNGFYTTLRRIMPDWEKRKERLERVII